MSDFEIAMLDSGQGIGFSNCTCFSEDSVEYVFYECIEIYADCKGCKSMLQGKSVSACKFGYYRRVFGDISYSR